jgi:two-component system, NtrC family, sensor histidine kinase HydH
VTAPASKARVLVVDDNRELTENLLEILADAGYSVTAAGSCAGALEAARAGLELALVDVRLPDGDGISLAGKLKENNPDSEVILLTGFATLESATSAVRAGACAYLLKPCATPDLLLTIEQGMRQVRLYQEKRELARRAAVAEKLAAVGTLTAGLSHEIRNPLNAAGLQLSVVERRVRRLPDDTQGPLLEPLGLVRDEIRRLEQILQDFLQFARPRQFTPRPVELGRLYETVKALFQEDADNRRVTLELDYASLPPVLGDEGQLRQVVVNLALNALAITPPGGRVRLACYQADREAVLTVEDSGPGISEEVLHRIFEPFFTTKASGTGLGLAIVHSIVSQHGGRISAENGPSSGARFTVWLPLSA